MPLQIDPAGGTLNGGAHADHVGYNETLAREVCTAPITDQIGVNFALNPVDFTHGNVVNWCRSCHDAETGDIDPLTGLKLFGNRYQLMAFLDTTCFIMCSVFVGLQMAKEFNDIEMSKLVVRHAGGNIDRWCHYCFIANNFLRRNLFLPSVVASVPLLVLTQGSDAMRICFNTVAVVFLCELDDNFYAVTVSDEAKGRIAKSSRALLRLSGAEQDALHQSKKVLVGSVTFCMPLALWWNGSTLDGYLAVTGLLIISWFAFVPAEIVAHLATSSATGRSSSSNTAQVVAVAILKALVVPFVWFLLAFYIIPS